MSAEMKVSVLVRGWALLGRKRGLCRRDDSRLDGNAKNGGRLYFDG